ncbi:MAG: Hsp70 family protein [Lachnospiraceae bacterium]|nr:Hsp70 family protein [Lachnospiraceae bacterium]
MILGIDLGTTYSAGAYLDKDGDVRVIDNEEGSTLTPSVVFVEDKTHTIVGETAKDNAILEPEKVISVIKNEMGKRTVVLEQDGIEYTPEIISSFILKKIAHDAETSTGEKVEGLVITVPAYFKDSQRKATEDAATISGYPLLGMINEPTAAALCYIRENEVKNEKLLVYDLGGGTFDVTILNVKDEENIEVISTDGLSHAGGSFFDKDIVELVRNKVRETSGIDLYGEAYAHDLQDLFIRAEKVKKELSLRESAKVILRVGAAPISVPLTREDLNDIVKDTCDKTKRKIAQALENAGLSKSDIDRVILIGGSSRIPYIRDEISAFMGKEIQRDINPDEAVAVGAAIYADILSKGKTNFTDVNSHSIGLVVINKEGKEENERIILRNTHLPAEKTRRFKTVAEDQKSIVLSVTEGEYKELTDVTVIGNFEIDLPAQVPKGSLVEITISLDVYQLIHLNVSLPDFHISEEYHMKRAANMDDEELTRVKQVFSGEKGSDADYDVKLDENLQKILNEMDALIGLASVKEQVRKRIYSIEADRRAKEAGALRTGGTGTQHMLFTGNPGTGKTTIARIMGRIYKSLGILQNGDKVVECTRGNLVGMYQGHSAKNVQDKFKEAEGGILFIDEAYSLCIDERDSFGRETVDEIVAQMENHRDDVIVICAGYKKEMEEFLKANSGLKSRFRHEIEFEDYSVDEMCEIFEQFCTSSSMNLEVAAKDYLRSYIETQAKVPNFGNARGVRNLYDDVREVQNERLLKERSAGRNLTAKDYDTITSEDIEATAGKRLEGEKTLDDLLNEVNSLTGLSAAKQKVQEMVDAILVREKMKERGIETDDENGTLHLIFKGNAGTGKTTIARLLGQIYTKLGVLQKNVFVETGRADLVGHYMGETAKKVTEKIEEADGGILFIDEAYTLMNGDNDEFGREAIQTLVAELENRRKSLMCIVAGYGKDMDEFLSVNQGLASRLSNEIIFEDYNDEELVEIFSSMCEDKGLKVAVPTEKIKEIIGIVKANKKDFGNARGVRNVLDNCIRRKDSRIASLLRAGEHVPDDDFITLIEEDLNLSE